MLASKEVLIHSELQRLLNTKSKYEKLSERIDAKWNKIRSTLYNVRRKVSSVNAKISFYEKMLHTLKIEEMNFFEVDCWYSRYSELFYIAKEVREQNEEDGLELLKKFLIYKFDLSYTRASVGIAICRGSPAYVYYADFDKNDNVPKTISRTDALSILVQYNFDAKRLIAAAEDIRRQIESNWYARSKRITTLMRFTPRYEFATKRKKTLRPRVKK
ncbi:MAG: hypothetical protein DRP09_22080 [Candidatus Thorarchaeota archaeon]|nr:MAG: hypothetical protein DRP09_22080 [Candidatus Thorarchaeota archaeon]